MFLSLSPSLRRLLTPIWLWWWLFPNNHWKSTKRRESEREDENFPLFSMTNRSARSVESLGDIRPETKLPFSWKLKSFIWTFSSFKSSIKHRITLKLTQSGEARWRTSQSTRFDHGECQFGSFWRRWWDEAKKWKEKLDFFSEELESEKVQRKFSLKTLRRPMKTAKIRDEAQSDAN